MSSTVKRGSSPPPVGMQGKKQHLAHNNGSGPPPLSYCAEPADDVNMNEVMDEKIELEFIQPSGNSCDITVDPSIPMYDLRIQLAARSKVSPSGYTLLVLSEDTGKPLEYKANQTIGSLDGRTVQLLLKTSQNDKNKKFFKEPTKGARPFEMTHRFTVNLPRNQKMVVRIPSAMTLEQLHTKVCQEKNMEPSRYAFQHVTNPAFGLAAKTTIADLQCTEINFVPIGMMDSAQSMPNLSQDAAPSYMPTTEIKKKRGFLSFLKRDKKLKLHDDTGPSVNQKHSSAVVTTLSTPPEQRNSFGQVRPKSMFPGSAADSEIQIENGFAQGKEAKAAAKGVKKRHAPPPPQKKVVPPTVEIKVKDSGSDGDIVEQPNQNLIKDDKSRSEITIQAEVNGSGNNSVKNVQRLHSRNSSDSSGYHELTLSGAESPEAHRVSTAFKMSTDATSIESTDNINDVSRVQTSSAVQDVAAGDSQTLPLVKSANKQPRRSHSLERMEKSNKALPSSKKKRAPAPPGSAKVPPLKTTAPSSQTASTTDTNQPKPEQVIQEEPPSYEDAVDVAAPHDVDDALTGMMMVEDTSICSEDLDNVEQAKLRPCSFVAPPPPNEPPPADMPPADYSPILDQHKTTVTTDAETEVNDNASLGPSSLKNSPVSVHSRSNSACSSNSIDEIGLSFQLTIAAGEEALANEQQQAEAESGYKTEMAIFVERMSMLTENAHEPNNSDSNIILSMDDTESNSETGSVIRHDTSGTSDVVLGDSPRMNVSSESGSIHLRQSSENSLERPSPRDMILPEETDNNIEVSDITLAMPVVPPPPEFQNDSQASDEIKQSPRDSPIMSKIELDLSSLDRELEDEDDERKSGDYEDEEYTETIEEVVVNFAPQSGYTFGGAYRIPDLDSKKEYAHLSDSRHSRVSEPKLSYSSFDAGLSFKQESKLEKDKNSPREKEEFVLSLDDLQSISYTAGSCKQKKLPQTADTDHKDDYSYSSPRDSMQTNQGGAETVYLDLITTDQTSNMEDIRQDDVRHDDVRHDDVRQRCSDLNFPTHSEGEVDSVLEEKSISQIALPAIRTNVSPSDLSESDNDSLSDKYTSTKSVILGSQKAQESNVDSDNEDAVLASFAHISDDASDTRGVDSPRGHSKESSLGDDDDEVQKQQIAMQAQYELLQSQFNQWQQQLLKNQKLLASQQILPEQNQSHHLQQMQLQIQMQEQIMQQLRQSMEALDLQKQQHGKSVKTDNGVMDSKTEESPVTKESDVPVMKESGYTVMKESGYTVLKESGYRKEVEADRKIVNESAVSRVEESQAVPAPPPPPTVPKNQFGLKPVQRNRPKTDISRFQRQLDPREELMIAIRTFGGRNGLKIVPVEDTHWHVNTADANTGL